MGPQHIAAENARDSLQREPAEVGLQWGRSTSLRKTTEEEHRRGTAKRASMGPQHIAAENDRALRAVEKVMEASMGPQHIAAENFHGKRKVFLGKRLQWGRSTSLRKTTGGCSNLYVTRQLQWGRSTSLRKTSCKVNGLCKQYLASMGPQHIAAENAGPRRSGCLSAPLQWGRSTSLRKTTTVPRMLSVQLVLQWGRSTSLRKTSDTAPGRRAMPGRFNGAAAHRCGKPEPEPRGSLGGSPLQWGRSTSLRKTNLEPTRARWSRGFNGAAAHRCGKL